MVPAQALGKPGLTPQLAIFLQLPPVLGQHLPPFPAPIRSPRCRCCCCAAALVLPLLLLLLLLLVLRARELRRKLGLLELALQRRIELQAGQFGRELESRHGRRMRITKEQQRSRACERQRRRTCSVPCSVAAAGASHCRPAWTATCCSSALRHGWGGAGQAGCGGLHKPVGPPPGNAAALQRTSCGRAHAAAPPGRAALPLPPWPGEPLLPARGRKGLTAPALRSGSNWQCLHVLGRPAAPPRRGEAQHTARP